jgi:hypothetical protein
MPQRTNVVPPPVPQPTHIMSQPTPSPRQPQLGTAIVPPPPPPPKKFPAMALVGLIAMTLCLCVTLAGIGYVDTTRVGTPTLVAGPATPVVTPTDPPTPTPAPVPTIIPTPTANPPHPVVAMHIFTTTGRFGFQTTEGDPAKSNDNNKPLTFRQERTTQLPNGRTSNTRVQVDTRTPLFGEGEGRFVRAPALNPVGTEMTAVWEFNRVAFTQTVQIVQSTSTWRFDTFRVEYTAENRDAITHTVGLRWMIDTLIGDNDGVPFLVPGRPGLIATPLDLRGADIPNYVHVYENQDIANPGVVVQITLSGGDATAPDRFVIAPWCDDNAGWDFLQEVGGAAIGTMRQCGNTGKGENKLDSAVGIYYDAKSLAPGEARRYTTFYGLGEISRPELTSTLALALSQRQARVGEKFYITALVQNPKAGQRVKIELPPELQRISGDEEQAVPQVGVPLTQVSWMVQALRARTNAPITITLSSGGSQTDQITLIAPPTPTPTRTRPPCTPSVTNPVCP